MDFSVVRFDCCLDPQGFRHEICIVNIYCNESADKSLLVCRDDISGARETVSAIHPILERKTVNLIPNCRGNCGPILTFLQ
jgi:hypothetical protein